MRSAAYRRGRRAQGLASGDLCSCSLHHLISGRTAMARTHIPLACGEEAIRMRPIYETACSLALAWHGHHPSRADRGRCRDADAFVKSLHLRPQMLGAFRQHHHGRHLDLLQVHRPAQGQATVQMARRLQPRDLHGRPCPDQGLRAQDPDRQRREHRREFSPAEGDGGQARRDCGSGDRRARQVDGDQGRKA
jgi:hypothetical protein